MVLIPLTPEPNPMNPTLTLSPTFVRRLAITKQRLANPQPSSDPSGILETARALGCLQLDPISAVERSHLLVLWSRLGPYNLTDLDQVLWQDRQLFEYWAHAASLVLTEDYPLFQHTMKHHGIGDSSWSKRIREWVEANQALYDHVLTEISERGPLLSRQIEDLSEREWSSSGWTEGRNVSRMLDYLWTKGKIMVAGRQGGQKLWDLAERFLPEWTPRETLPKHEIVRRATVKAIRALGVATPTHIRYHFMRGTYTNLAKVLAELEAETLVQQVQVVGAGAENWPGPWYIHTEDLPLLEQIQTGGWKPRTTLLSPFDNLIADRSRTELLFDFNFRIEIYVPKAKRQYGYYVLPILHGDRLVGRIDPVMDRKRKRLTINAVHTEPNVSMQEEDFRAVGAAVTELGTFLGATQIEYPKNMPPGWKAD
jgi:uncharacterized protein